MATIFISASYRNLAKDFFADLVEGNPISLHATIDDPAALAGMPKSVGFKYGQMMVNLWATEANGGLNENGIKRYRSMVRNAEKLGIEIVFRGTSRNSYASREHFEAAIS